MYNLRIECKSTGFDLLNENAVPVNNKRAHTYLFHCFRPRERRAVIAHHRKHHPAPAVKAMMTELKWKGAKRLRFLEVRTRGPF